MVSGEAMSTKGKFVLLCCHFDTVFQTFCCMFFAILLWHSGSLRDVKWAKPSALWDYGSLAYGFGCSIKKPLHVKVTFFLFFVFVLLCPS